MTKVADARSPRSANLAAVERLARYAAGLGIATFVVVLATEFAVSWNAARAARASALVVWAGKDAGRVAVVRRFHACDQGTAKDTNGAITVNDCVRYAAESQEADLRDVVEMATRQVNQFSPAPLRWFSN